MRSAHIESGRRALALLVTTALLPGCGGDRADPPAPESTQETTEAAPTVPAAADPDLEKTLASMEDDAREALRARDISGARRILAAGLALAEGAGRAHERARARLLMCAAELEREAGHEVEARRHLADAMAVFRVDHDDVGRFGVHLSQVRLEAMLGDYAAAGRALDEAAELLPAIEDQGLRGEFLVQTGRLASRRMRLEEARDTFIEAARVFLGAKKQAEHAEAMLLLADEEDRLGQTSQARSSLDKALKAFRELADKDGEVRAMHRQAGIAEREGRYRHARALLGKVRDLYAALGRAADAATVTRHMNALPETDR